MIHSLDQIRSKISLIDHKILELLKERMRCSVEVAEYKKENRLPIFDQNREEKMLEEYDSLVDFEVRPIFQAILDESKKIQSAFLS